MHTLTYMARVMGLSLSFVVLIALLFFAVYVVALPDIYR